MFKYASQFANALSPNNNNNYNNNNNNNYEEGELKKPVAGRRIQLEDDLRVGEIDAFDAFDAFDRDDVSIVESVNKMLADAQVLTTKFWHHQ